MFRKMATMAAALSLVAGSVVPAMAAQPLSLAQSPAARASADAGASSNLNGHYSDTTVQIAILVIIALLIWAGTELLDNDNDNLSNSP